MFEIVSDAMSPDEFLRDSTFWYIAKVLEEGTIFEVYVQAIAKAMVLFASEQVLIHYKGIFRFSSACFKARQRREAYFLGKS